MRMQTVMEVLEEALDYALLADAHHREYKRAIREPRSASSHAPTVADAHFYASIYLRESADMFWRHIDVARVA